MADTSLDLSQENVGLLRDGSSQLIANEGGPPKRVDGFVVGAPVLTREPPHDGEMHPDGDELLYLISGHLDVLLEEDGGWRSVELKPGGALVVPRGVWHKVRLREPSQLIHVTPGPGGEHRPLPAS
jgi:mannose-6-phosphate isomerase-like protein (cupin superfamily)